jgi:hypothetical protein
LVGPFKKAKGGFTHIFITMDKFTKLIEVKPAASITMAKAVEFIKEITVREFKDFCTDSGIKLIRPQCHTRRATDKWSAQMA